MALFGFGDMCVRTDENPEVFVLCIRCWPRHRRKHRMKKLKKVAFSHFFDTLKRLQGASFKSVIKYFIRRVFVAEFVSKLFSYGKGA